MNIQSIRIIDSAMGLTVFLLLAVAIVAGQGRANLSTSENRNLDRQAQIQAEALPTTDQLRTLAELSEIVDHMNAVHTGVDFLLDMRLQENRDRRAIPIGD